MPILSKGGRRVYFAHVPKTGGSAVYILFLAGGWRIANLETGPQPGRIGHHIRERFGDVALPVEGERHGHAGTLQHAPADVWTRWGPFDDSVAIVRHPVARFLSEMRYRYAQRVRRERFARFMRAQVEAARRAFDGGPDGVDSHLVPQHRFVAQATYVLRYEDDWGAALARRYGLDPGALPAVNVSPLAPARLARRDHDWLRATYAEDFRRFGYDPDAHAPAPRWMVWT